MRRAIILSLPLWLAAIAASQTGTVKADGQPVPGAVVRATQGERVLGTVTDASGVYTLDGLSPGAWVLHVEMFGFQPARRPVQVGAQPPKIDFNLELLDRQAAAPPAAGAAQLPDEPERPDARPMAGPTDPNALGAENANEAFLVSGSLSRGLEAQRGEFGPFGEAAFDRMEMMRAAGFGPPGAGGPGEPDGGPGGPLEGRGGPVGGPGGFGGPPGGFRGGPPPGGVVGRGGVGGPPGGFRGGPPGGGDAGRGGPGGRGGPPPGAARGGPREAGVASVIGNRARRGSPVNASLFFTLRNSALDARPLSLNGLDQPKAAYAQSRFGFTFGGPLRIPKVLSSERTFLFLSYFGSLTRNPYSAVGIVPGPAERAGNLSLVDAVIHDPATRAPFPSNTIPASRIHPIARGLLPYIPPPNQPGQVQNYRYEGAAAQDSHNLSLRLNQTLSRTDRLAGSFNTQSRAGNNLQMFGFRDESSGSGFNVDLSWSHNLARRSVNSLRASVNSNRSEMVPFFAFGRNVAGQLGIGGTSSEAVNFGPPNLSFTNYAALADASPSLQRTYSFGVSESLSLPRGAHNLSFGVDFRRNFVNTRTDQNGRGSFSFSGLATSGFDARGLPQAATGYDWADFLLGLPQSASIRYGSANTYFHGDSLAFFGQDDWRMRRNLTLNLGLRYEYLEPLREKYGRIANLDIAPGFTGVAVVTPGQTGRYTGLFPEGLIDPDRNNFSPRAGLAWRGSQKRPMQVRAGYGLHFNGGVYNQFARQLAAQPPFANTNSINTSAGAPLTLADGFTLTVPGKQVTNTFAVDRHYRVGYAQTWSFSVQQELPSALVVEIGYLGTKGTRLDVQRSPNRAAPGSPLTAEQRRQIGNAIGFLFNSAEANSIHHAAQVRVTRRLRGGLSGMLLYTFGKSIDNSSTFGGVGNAVAQNDRDLRAERGLSSFDRRHALTTNLLISSPVGGRGGLLASHPAATRLLRDWTLTWSVTANSGPPLTARVLGNRSDAGGTGVTGSGRADSTGLAVDAGTGFFNFAAFGVPLAGRFGNAGRNTVPGPDLLSMNASVGRSIQLGDRRRVEIRLEANNVTNHPSVTNFGTVVNSLLYGLPIAAGRMRSMQATLRFRL